MAVSITIPLASGNPSFRQRTPLDGREYVLAFRWSEREARWYFDIFDANGNVLAAGMKIVSNWPLLESRRFSPGVPPGELFAVDRRAEPVDPGFAELGTVVPLVYFPSAVVVAAEATSA